MLAEDIRHPEKQLKSSKGGRKKYKRQKKGQKREGVLLINKIAKGEEYKILPNQF